MLIDSHCHLNFRDSYPDLDVVRRDMNESGVDHCIVVGIDVPSSETAVELGRHHSWIHPSSGVHPCSREFDDTDDSWDRIRTLAADPVTVAVGETGLDRFHDDVPLDLQKIRFERHLDIARELGKPVIVHCRDADDECLEFLERHGTGVRGVLHCWAGGLALAEHAISNDWYVSLAGNVTFKNATDLQTAAARIPPDRLLVETDSPFLTPHPHRGRPNHPGMTSFVARKLAELHDLDYDELAAVTRRNTLQLFQLEGVQE